MGIDGQTKPIAILGNPLGHTLSPLMHNFLFKATGLNNVYIPLEVQEDNLDSALQGLWSLGFIGANVTIPYKEKVMDYLVELSEEAILIGAVNTLIRSNAGGFKGDNTDGRGFLNALLAEKNWQPRGKKAVILGAGGSARAVGTALALKGVSELTIVNRTLSKAREITNKISGEIGIKAVAMSWNNLGLKDNISDTDIIINTTPLGMKPKLDQIPPLDIKWLGSGQLVVDLIYNPLTTGFLEKSSMQGCETSNGLGMLIHQGILSFELWTGRKPPLDGLRELMENQLLESV